MLEFLKRIGKKELVASYVPEPKEIQIAVRDLILKASSDKKIYDGLLSLAGTSSYLAFYAVEEGKEKEDEAGSLIMATGRDEHVIIIEPGASGTSLIGVKRTKKEMFFWEVPYAEIGNRQGLGKATESIVLGKIEPQVYSLETGKILQNAVLGM